MLSEQLRQAFRNTHYRFAAPGGELLLQVDCANAALRELLRACGQAGAAALTACNPFAQQRDASENHRSQLQLERELGLLGLQCIPGRHEDPAGIWPVEISVLVLGLDCAQARAIATRYGQLAFLWSDAAGIPRLMEAAVRE